MDRSNSYCNPIVIIQTICYFLIFKNIKITNNTINAVAGNTLGIYLIHDNEFMREYMYKNIFKMTLENNWFTTSMLHRLPIYVLIVFIVCLTIEMLRKKLFERIYNLKISNKIRLKIKKYFCAKNLQW